MKRNILILLAFVLVIPMGFAQSRNNASRISDRDLGNVIYVMGEMYPEGFTLDLNTMPQPTQGLMVSYKET